MTPPDPALALGLTDSIAAYELARLAESVRSSAQLFASGTWQRYEARVARLACSHSRGDPYALYVSRIRSGSWSNRNSRQGDRSALVRLAARDILDLMPLYWSDLLASAADHSAREEIISGVSGVMPRQILATTQPDLPALDEEDSASLLRAASFLLREPPDPHHTRIRAHESQVDNQGSQGRKRTAKDLLIALNRHTRRKRRDAPGYDWRDHLWRAAIFQDRHINDDQRGCIAVMMLTGCRPSEFAEELGVEIRTRHEEDAPILSVRIHGSKVDRPTDPDVPAKGQEVRKLVLSCDTPEAKWLHDHVARQPDGAQRLKWTTPVQTRTGVPLSPTERRRRVTVSIGKIVKRLGRIAFPRLNRALTPYVFRHALAADLKASGFDEEDIARALGHLSTRTQEHYGSVTSSRGLDAGRAAQIHRIAAAEPVRTAPARGWGDESSPSSILE